MKNNRKMIITFLLMTFSLSFVNNVSAISVQDTDNPVISEVSTPLLFEEGTPGMNVSWTVNDANPDKYTINVSEDVWSGVVTDFTHVNLGIFQSGSWTDGQVFTYNVSHLKERYWSNVSATLGYEVGYQVTLVVNDTSGNEAMSFVKVRVTPAPITTTPASAPGFLTLSSIFGLIGVCNYLSRRRK